MEGTNNVAVFTTSHRFEGLIPDEVLDITSLGKGLELLKSQKVLFTKEIATKMLEMKNSDEV